MLQSKHKSFSRTMLGGLLLTIWPIVVAAEQTIKATDMLLPETLGKIQARIDGVGGQPLVVVIGESHVSLKVQQAVADTLSYLHAAYSMKIVCSEGFSGPLLLEHRGDSVIAARMAAKADLLSRRISGIEYIARAYPDIQVVGIEDMSAKNAHGQALNQGTKGAEQWASDFQHFIQDDLGNLQVSQSDGERVVAAFKKFVETKDLDQFVAILYQITGRESPIGQKLTSLIKRREDIKKASNIVDENDPLMKNRDTAMIANTLRVSQKTELTALVIGKFHIPGIERQLKAKGTSYVTVLVSGVDDENEAASSEDGIIYDQWNKGIKTAFEEWLSRFKPLPAASRSTFAQRSSILNGLVNADFMLRQGSSLEQIQNITARADLPTGFQIRSVYRVPGGNAIEFLFNGKKAYAYFSTDPSKIEAGSRFEKLEGGSSGGRHYAIYDGGSGGEPPIPPFRGREDMGPPPDGNGAEGEFNKRYLAAVKKQKQQNPEAITVAFVVEDGIFKRRVGENTRDLGVAFNDVKEWAQRYEESKMGPDTFLAAQQLAESLLADLDKDLPSRGSIVYQLSEDDFLNGISLPDLARLIRPSGTEHFQTMPEVYAIPKKFQGDLINLLNKIPSPVNIEKTVVWITDSLKISPQYSDTLNTIKNAGALVNEDPPSGATLILLGATTGDWSVTLKSGARVSISSGEFQRAIREAESVVSINTELADSVVAEAKKFRREKVDNQEVLATGKKIIDEIKNESGEESIDRVTRKSASEESQKLGDLLTKKSTQETASQALRDVAGLTKRPTLLQRE